MYAYIHTLLSKIIDTDIVIYHFYLSAFAGPGEGNTVMYKKAMLRVCIMMGVWFC